MTELDTTLLDLEEQLWAADRKGDTSFYIGPRGPRRRRPR
jgi:hypothetical protein